MSEELKDHSNKNFKVIKKKLIDSFNDSYQNAKGEHYKGSKKNKALIGLLLSEKRSDAVDKLIIRVLEEHGFDELKDVSIVALGGYGRRELSPYSDIDLLILYKSESKTLAKSIVECLLYFLWDLNLDTGHSVRTIEECVELSYDKSDTTILTSLLDSRFICGDSNLYDKLDNELYNEVLPRISSDFIKRKLEEKANRHNRFGKSVYLLEPNIKEGDGGLRDLHTAIWIAQAKHKIKSLEEILQKGFISAKQYRVIEKCVSFLLFVRSELHYQAKRREDNLIFRFQEGIANFLGYKESKIKAVEKFMRVYYLRANLVRLQSNIIIEKCVQKRRSGNIRKITYLDHGFIIQGGILSVTSRNVFKEDPTNMLRAFEYADLHNLEKSNYLVSLLHKSALLINDEVRKNREFNFTFLRILKTSKNVSKILFEMNEIHLLSHYIPEFGKIVCLGQFEAYHLYTIDIHSIFMVEEIDKLINYEYEEEFAVQTKIAESLVKRHVLYLACLFHDMGKGSGKNHAQKGAAMIPKISERMGLNDYESKQLEFLVRHHIVMSHFSQRRDISDPTLISRFARSVKNIETLSLLYLLTFADIRSVAPGVWTNWKGMLLFELYLRTSRSIEMDKYVVETIEYKAQRTIRDLIKSLDGKIERSKVSKILEKMPYPYFYGFSYKSIIQHIKLIDLAGENIGTDVKFYPSEEYDEFTFWGFRGEGTFSKVCGVMTINRLNILGARIFTTSDNRVLCILYVNKLGKSTVEEKYIWEKVKDDIKNVISGELKVDELVEKRKKNISKYKKEIPKHPSKIEFDNKTSYKATIIDIHTNDRTGLLYDITKTFRNIGLLIDSAKISTRADQVVDAFYVQNSKGKTIRDPKMIENIEKQLLKVVDET